MTLPAMQANVLHLSARIIDVRVEPVCRRFRRSAADFKLDIPELVRPSVSAGKKDLDRLFVLVQYVIHLVFYYCPHLHVLSRPFWSGAAPISKSG